MRTTLFLPLTILACQPAFASGGVHCSADADGVTIDVGGGVTRGMGGPLFSFEGTLDIADKSVAADLGQDGIRARACRAILARRRGSAPAPLSRAGGRQGARLCRTDH